MVYPLSIYLIYLSPCLIKTHGTSLLGWLKVNLFLIPITIISQDDYFDFKENNAFALFPRRGLDVTDDSRAISASNSLMG